MDKRPEGKVAKFANFVLAACILALVVAVTFKMVRWIVGF